MLRTHVKKTDNFAEGQKESGTRGGCDPCAGEPGFEDAEFYQMSPVQAQSMVTGLDEPGDIRLERECASKTRKRQGAGRGAASQGPA